jgi:hypothetical protein
MKTIISFFLIPIFLIPVASGQRLTDDVVVAHSWNQKAGKIIEQSITVSLNSTNSRYDASIPGPKDARYCLSIIPNYARSLKVQHWKVSLTESSDWKCRIETSSDDLLFAEHHGSIGDNFPREDLVAYFYVDRTKSVLINGQPWIDGKWPLYPPETIRKIYVKNFLVTLRLESSIDKMKTDAIHLTIEFSNER